MNKKLLVLSAALMVSTAVPPVEANPLKDRTVKIVKKVKHFTNAVIQLPAYLGLHLALGIGHWYMDEVRQ